MPLPKMPNKPAALLSPVDYPKAEKGKTVKPSIALVTTLPALPANVPLARTKTETPARDNPSARRSRSSTSSKSGTSRSSTPRGVTKLFVLDTNVLMHDPTSLFRFAEHDIYLPMITLEELDNHKKGMSEVARNARQVSRSLDALVADVSEDAIDSIKMLQVDCSFKHDSDDGLFPKVYPKVRLTIKFSASYARFKSNNPNAQWYWCRKTSTCASKQGRSDYQQKSTLTIMYWKTPICSTPAFFS
jgi:hypothetical protein